MSLFSQYLGTRSIAPTSYKATSPAATGPGIFGSFASGATQPPVMRRPSRVVGGRATVFQHQIEQDVAHHQHFTAARNLQTQER